MRQEKPKKRGGEEAKSKSQDCCVTFKAKLHKTPYRARFIAGSSSCTTTRLSKLITESLKLVRSHCTAYCKTIRERTGVNCMWIINNSLDVIRALEEKQLSLNHVSTWDFSTLYTSLPHTQLKRQFHDLLILKGKASLLPIIFAPSGRMIRRQRGTRTSPVESLVSLLTFLSITSTFVLEARFSGRLLVYPWAPTVHLCWLISSFIPLSTILWSKQ